MTGFAADWLALREPADWAARSTAVLEACKAHFAGMADISVCDLGSGTGAAVDAFGSYLPERQRWLLTDNDPANLAVARRDRQRAGIGIETAIADLAANPAVWPGHCQLATATALFDLASAGWIAAFAVKLAASRLPLLASLTYDGKQTFSPIHPADGTMLDAFNRHQRLDKGLGGPAAGPDAPRFLRESLEHHGYRTLERSSPWVLNGERDAALIAEVLQGWVDAVTGAGFVGKAQAHGWLAERLAGTAAMTVGHTDLWAVPPVP